jgi:hypothetical protein
MSHDSVVEVGGVIGQAERELSPESHATKAPHGPLSDAMRF